jgi:DMSO/TMAO reductase YedYZ molybdopterin-dependent catalytic subunit
MNAIRTHALAAVLVAHASLLAAQTPQAPQAPTRPRTGTLVIAGDVATPITLTPADLKALPRRTVTMQEDGRAVAYEGVLVGELLKRAGAASGNDLRGSAVAAYVVAGANDGYQAVFSVAELDPLFTGSEILVADTADGKPLFDYQGPLRLVAPRDTRAARSVRMLETLDVVRLRK